MKQDPAALFFLNALASKSDQGRLARYSAVVIVSAYCIARDAPAVRTEACRIVDVARKLYAVLPSREDLDDLTAQFLQRIVPLGNNRRAVEDERRKFVEALWLLFQDGIVREEAV